MNENNTSSLKTQKSEKKKRRFNFIDFLLIFIVVVLVATLVYAFIPSNLISGLFADETVEIEYSIEITGVDKEFGDKINDIIKENDIVLDSVSKANIGTVTAVQSAPQQTLALIIPSEQDGTNQGATNQEEKNEVIDVPNKCNITITITAKAHYNKGEGYSVNGTRIAVGEKISVAFPNFVGEGYCISVPRNKA